MRKQAIALVTVTILEVVSTADASPPAPCAEIPNAECGILRVAEDRSAVGGRVLDLDYVVIPAQREEISPPIFFLLGGPGEAATSVAPFVLSSPLADILDRRALVLLDQRGTGGSHRLQCPPPDEPARHFGGLFDPVDVKTCRDVLVEKADLRLYTTSIAVEDLDELRRHLGYDRIALWGGSYGTRVAMEYLRRHGSRVERALLDAVSGLDGTMPLYFAHDAQAAFDRVVDDCERESACSAAFPDLHADLAAALDRLRDGPVDVEIAVGNGRPAVTIPFSLGDLGYAIRGMLYSSRETAFLPADLHAAATTGDFRALAQIYYRRSASLGGALANGMYLSVICAEDVPFVTDELARRWSAGTFLGEYLIHDYRGACDLWDRGEIPKDYRDGVRADTPVLIFSGGRDPSTPPRWGERAVEGLFNGRHIVFPYGGHGVGDTPCGAAIAREFFAGVPPAELDASCVNDEGQRPEFKTPS